MARSENVEGSSVIAIECRTHRTMAQGTVTVEYILPSILLTVDCIVTCRFATRAILWNFENTREINFRESVFVNNVIRRSTPYLEIYIREFSSFSLAVKQLVFFVPVVLCNRDICIAISHYLNLLPKNFCLLGWIVS